MTQPPSYPAVPPAGAYPGPSAPPPPPGHPPAGYGSQPGFGAPGFGQPMPPPPPVSPAGQPLASFGDRLLALLIDSAILGGVAMVAAIPVMIIYIMAIIPDSSEVTADGTLIAPDFFGDFLLPMLLMYAAVFAISLTAAYIYYVEMMFRTGQTTGKKLIKIKIVPLDPALTLTRGAAVRRLLVQQGSGLVPGLNYIDGLWQLWDKPYQQCLHDKFARTVVVKVPG
ncbi:RDD family protein [Micromonospora sp. NPDC003197]